MGADDSPLRTGADGPGRWAPLREYARWLAPHRGAITVVFLIATVAGILGLAPPYASKLIIDNVLTAEWDAPAERLRWLHLAGGGVLAILLLSQGIEWVRHYRMAVLNAKVLQQ